MTTSKAIFFFLILMPVVALAQTTTDLDTGQIRLSGIVTNTSADEFTMRVDEENVTVSTEQINEDTMEYLTDSDIVKEGSYVTVVGEIGEDPVTREIIARSVQTYIN